MKLALAVALALSALVASLMPGSARADADPVGPAIGNNRYRSTISGAADSDDFTGNFLEGEALSISVVAQKPPKAKLPTLQPILVLVDPAGVVRTSGIVTAKNLFSASAKEFPIDTTGLWTVRVSGRDGTTGDFVVTFRVRPASKLTLKKKKLGGDLPTTAVYQVPGFAGAMLDALVVTKKGGTPVELSGLTDPDGAEVKGDDGKPAIDHVVSKSHGLREELRTVLGPSAGAYGVRVRIPNGSAQYDITLGVTPPPRPAGKKTPVLAVVEPVLDARTIPLIAEPGDTVTITGSGFSVTPPAAVFFGTARSPSVTVAADGKSMDVVVPPRAGPAVVALYVINPDGQGMGRASYFGYLPPPVATDVLDDATGTQIRAVSAAGGRVLRIVGDHFDPGYVVRVGGTTAAATYVSVTEYRFTMPAVAQGNHSVTVTDPFSRTGTTPFTVFCKTPPSFAALPYTPAALALGVQATITIHGTGFLASDRLLFASQDYTSTFVDGSTRTFDVPPLQAGDYTVRLIDSIGTTVDGPAFTAKPAPTIIAATVVAGPVLAGNEIPVTGGSEIEVTGTSFHYADTVTLGGATVTSILSRTATKFRFRAPAASAGSATLAVTDGANQTATLTGALRYAGFVDQSSSRAPSKTSVDDFSAVRAAAGDLDLDGSADDVVIVSPYGSTIGSRATLTRVLLGNASGKLVDATATSVPSPRSFSTVQDNWDAQCVAVGDLDGGGGPEIVLGGQVVAYSGTSAYSQVRLFKNGGSGTFTNDTVNEPPSRNLNVVLGVYYIPYYGLYYYQAYGASTQAGVPTAIALGDIDRDTAGDLDMVVGTDHFQQRHVYYDPRYLTYAYGVAVFTQYPPYIQVNYEQYLPATHVFVNRISEGLKFEHRSLSNLPRAGSSAKVATQPAALHCRDLALGDIDLDGYQDLVVAWNDPLTVTAYGLRTKLATGTSKAQPMVATRVLLNDRTGAFPTDATATWMPAPQSPEYFQADRMLLRDLNGDSYPELILLLSKGLDAFAGTETHGARCLRVLRNDRTKFTNVSATSLPALDGVTTEDFRGTALAVRDVNGDGFEDILVSTRDALTDAAGAAAPRCRIFFGAAGLTFQLQPAFSAGVGVDSGEASELLFVGDLGGTGKPVLLLAGPSNPATSPSATPVLRGEEWKR